MLTLRKPDPRRRFAGTLLIATGMVAMAGFAYAASQNGAVTPVLQKPLSYQLAMSISRDGKQINHFTLCSDGAQPMLVTSQDGQGALNMTLSVHSVGGGQAQIDVDGSVGKPDHSTSISSKLRGAFGHPVSMIFNAADQASAPLSVSMTPTVGCSAASVAIDQKTITQSIKNGHVRDVAQAIASEGGYQLANADALDERSVSFNFEQIPVERALQLIAQIDGKVAVIQGKQVRFDKVAAG